MQNFEYLQPKSLSKAYQIIKNDHGNSILFAGGTDVLGLIKDEIISPSKVINLKAVKGLDFIEKTKDDYIRIGALTKLTEIANNNIIKNNLPLLPLVIREVASPQLRNIGTIGGNICQRPRCFYFRGDFNCLRKGGDECFAYSGNNKYHCIIGGSPCYIVHPSDLAVALLVLDAKVKIFSGKGYFLLPISKFFILPEEDYRKENILKPGEIITEFIIPKNKFKYAKYLKVRQRGSWDFALVSLAIIYNLKGNKIKTVHLAFGGIAPIPWRNSKIESELNNLKLELSEIRNFTKELFQEASPLEMNSYKVQLARNLIIKALLD